VPPVSLQDPFQRTSPAPRVVVIIPARFDSTRFPGKALADIGGRPMIEHVCRRAAAARGVDAVVVATDDDRIVAAVGRFGGIARKTHAAHRTGTDRIAEVAHQLRCEIVLNVQGDEPLVHPAMIEDVLAPLADPQVRMTTLRRAIVDPGDYASPHVVKVVVNLEDDALYFSRAPVPFVRDAAADRPADRAAFKHIGIYGYRRDFLLEFAALPQTPLELAESLEQLRALEHGVRIRTPETQHDSIGVDTPEDLERVRRQLQELASPARA
jgi:3-deoxy-manno-octulosonate cytidylyltransferase (CMP-KDO synthetase)